MDRLGCRQMTSVSAAYGYHVVGREAVEEETRL